ncbi:AAA family ATPase [Aeromonas caviae]|uniref:AAA family ATPase n=1 Tax=Aeromonas caviae TaxID=648 RepID=UPI003015352C
MSNNTPIQLLSFEICNLYGLYTHKVNFKNSREDENTIILHGKNGVGKTALLKSIIFTFNGSFSSLIKIPFNKINSTLSDGSSLSINRVKVDSNDLFSIENRKRKLYKLEIELIRNSKKVATYTYEDVKNKHYRIIDNNPWMVQVDDDFILDRRTGERIPVDFFDNESIDVSLSGKKSKRMILLNYLKQIKVHLVETNRLFSHTTKNALIKREDNEQITPSVKNCAKQLAFHINKALKNYGETSQALDQSFPPRFINAPTPSMSLHDLKHRLQLLSQKISVLQDQGILDSKSLQPFDTESLDNVEHNKLEIMTLYVSDSEEKLKTFDELSNKVKLLLESLNNKFSNKRIVLSKEQGLVVYGQDDIEIELDDLSSGEQHEIVLLFELLFKVQPGTLVLIDEPELSLHVSWQKVFLPELISISENVGFYSILATHSPFIVGDRFDLMIALDSE